jgi:hypothetical protein
MLFRLFKRPSTLALEASLTALAVGYVLIVAGLAVPFLSFVGVAVMLAGLGVVFDLGAGTRQDAAPLWPAT